MQDYGDEDRSCERVVKEGLGYGGGPKKKHGREGGEIKKKKKSVEARMGGTRDNPKTVAHYDAFCFHHALRYEARGGGSHWTTLWPMEGHTHPH